MFKVARFSETTAMVRIENVSLCIFRTFGFGVQYIRNFDSTGWPNLQFSFFILKLMILFVAVGPPWEWFSYRYEKEQHRIAFGLVGIRFAFPSDIEARRQK